MVQVKHEGQALLFVIFGTDVFFLIRAIGTSAFAGVVDPANQVIVIVLFADASEICGETGTLHLVALANGVTSKTSARFEKLFAVGGIAGLVLGQRIRQARLPDVGRYGLDLTIVEAEVRHFGRRAEVARLFQPHGDPIAVQLQAHVLEIGADLFNVLEEALAGAIKLDDAEIELAVGDLESDGTIIEAVGFFIGRRSIGPFH